jgi:hypothetical protein
MQLPNLQSAAQLGIFYGLDQFEPTVRYWLVCNAFCLNAKHLADLAQCLWSGSAHVMSLGMVAVPRYPMR